MAEDLTEYLHENGVKVRYLHSDIDTLERIEIMRDLRMGVFDVLVGINLLREGLDIPECALVGILDADKEGFLRSETSLIQTIGRAARNINGRVILYADNVTPSMQRAINETDRRRTIQSEYNKKNNIKPSSIKKAIKETLDDDNYISNKKLEKISFTPKMKKKFPKIDQSNVINAVKELEKEMFRYARELEFEEAAKIRDQITSLQDNFLDMPNKQKKKQRS